VLAARGTMRSAPDLADDLRELTGTSEQRASDRESAPGEGATEEGATAPTEEER